MSDPHDGPETTARGAGRVSEVPNTLPVTHDDASVRRLLVIAGERVISQPLPDEGVVRIGRGEAVEPKIEHPSVSREHATLQLVPGRPMVVSDAGSSNGTRVRGKVLKPGQSVDVAPGETFEVGSVLLMVHAPFEIGTASTGEAPADTEGIVIEDQAMAGLHQLAERVAKTTINVLLLGETGVGKDVLARRVHAMSPRAEQPFLPLNCGALTEQLLESELFGHERGAFTGAVETKPGLLEAASGGTVFLDEVGELPMAVQVKLLRVLEDRQVRRVGGIKSRPFDVRFVAATNRDLSAAIEDGAFRADLFYRLNGISLVIPPLRQRPTEIEGLATKFIVDASARQERADVPRLSAEALVWLKGHAWPGNIRELQNTMERAVLLATGPEILCEHMPSSTTSSAPSPSTSAEAEDPQRQRILDALEACAGNQTRAAKLLGMSRNTLLARLDSYGVPRPRKAVRKPR